MNKIFTWVSLYNELSDWLLLQKDHQQKLITILKDIGITGFRDGHETGEYIELGEIDPFTFISYLNKFHSDERRIEILHNLRQKLQFECTEPTDVAGIPTIHPMKVHLFPRKSIRNKKDIDVLWTLFKQVKTGNVDERLFQTALNIKSVGKGKLSIVLFYVNPERYIPLDSNTSTYLRSKKLGYTYDSFASYKKLSEEIVRSLGKSPWEISYEAYTHAPENDVSSISSIRTLFERLEGELEEDMDYHIFYRGQYDKSFGLVPSIYREKYLIQNENRIFRDIIAQCPADFKGCTSTFEKLVKMQHYSLPTRLLDITTNPLVALYFACENDAVDGKLFRFEVRTTDIKYFDSDAVSVASNIAKRPLDFSIENLRDMDRNSFNQEEDIQYLLHEIKFEKPHFQNVIDSRDIERVFCVKPMFDNPRIIRQSGAFFLYGINGNKSKPASLNFGYKMYIINKAHKQRIRKQLEALGIDKSTLFPEVEHVAEHIKEKYHIS
ncbi:MAG: FRG domain-containing protein [Muribaculaceae bacterium]|nr:FRG domain-containing protein [Muribaculaceae bacterium]